MDFEGQWNERKSLWKEIQMFTAAADVHPKFWRTASGIMDPPLGT